MEPVSRLVFLSFTDLSDTGADAATVWLLPVSGTGDKCRTRKKGLAAVPPTFFLKSTSEPARRNIIIQFPVRSYLCALQFTNSSTDLRKAPTN